jgi:hypothetical protein
MKREPWLTPLFVWFSFNGDDLLAIEKNPAAFVDVFHRGAVHAMRFKPLEL